MSSTQNLTKYFWEIDSKAKQNVMGGQADEEKRQQSNRCKAGNHKQAVNLERDSKLNQSLCYRLHSKQSLQTHRVDAWWGMPIKERVWEPGLFGGGWKTSKQINSELNGRSWHRGDKVAWIEGHARVDMWFAAYQKSQHEKLCVGQPSAEISICIILVKLLSTGRELWANPALSFPYRFVSCQCSILILEWCTENNIYNYQV